MDEAGWLASTDPAAMLEEVRRLHASGLKLKLFACASCLRHCYQPEELTFIDDIDFTLNDLLNRPCEECRPKQEQASLLRCLFGNPFRPVRLPRAVIASGSRPAPEISSTAFTSWTQHGECPWLSWHDRTIPRLAQAIYDSRDFDRMPILADALEEAGCTNEEILMHCRGQEQCGQCKGTGSWMPMKFELRGPVACNKCLKGWRKTDAPHARGCWVLDLLLNKS